MNFQSYSTSCTMECKPLHGCTGCNQNVIRPCQIQDCDCLSGIGGCESHITYPDPPEQ